MSSTLAERLKAARERSGLSQAALGRSVGISPQAIQHLESGASRRSKYLTLIAGAIGVRPEWLESGDGPMENSGTVAVPLVIKTAESPTDKEDNSATSKIASFEISIANYRPEEIPVFVARRREYEKEEGKTKRTFPLIFSQIYEANKHVNSSFVELYLSRLFFSVVEEENHEYIPRPSYLKGQVDAYAIVVDSRYSGSPRVRRGDILHVSHYKIYRRGDLVLVWLKDGSFLLAEPDFGTDAEGLSIDIQEFLHTSGESPLWLERKFRAMKLPWSLIATVDVVLGAEYAGLAATASGRERLDDAYQRFLEKEREEEEKAVDAQAGAN